MTLGGLCVARCQLVAKKRTRTVAGQRGHTSSRCERGRKGMRTDGL
jgi:hypothetical protein